MKPPGKLQGENCGPKRKRKVATKGADLEECYEVVDADTRCSAISSTILVEGP